MRFRKKTFFLLGMGLTTFSALSLVEPPCLLPTQILQSEIAIHYQLELKTQNPYIRLVVEVENRFLNSPLSSLPFWRKSAFKRIVQLQQKLGQPSLQLEVLEDEVILIVFGLVVKISSQGDRYAVFDLQVRSKFV